MKSIALFGASGKTGGCIVEQAEELNYSVKALYRSGTAMPSAHSSFAPLAGSVLNYDDVLMTIEETESAICTLGARPPYTDLFCAHAAANIINAMNALKIKRLICITGAMIGKNAAPHLSAFMKIMYRNFNRKYPDIARDRSQQEELIMNSSLDWTIIKPGRLSNGKRKVSYKTGEELKISAFSSISRRGLADFILKILEDEKFFRRSIMIKN